MSFIDWFKNFCFQENKHNMNKYSNKNHSSILNQANILCQLSDLLEKQEDLTGTWI